jgi:predicted dehydrogenase
MLTAIGAGLTLALGDRLAAADDTSPSASEKVRLGFIGVGDRGTGLLKVALQYPQVQVPVICDIAPGAVKRAQDLVEKARGARPEGFDEDPHDYRRMLARDDFDAVIIATPQELHCEMAVDSMKAGKFVGSEVPACVSVEECWTLVKSAKAHNGKYMMLENYLYSQPVMMIQQMVNQGVFGDLTYGFGGYIHEIRGMRFEKNGSLTWRGENVLHTRGIVYPTHAIGPVCRWMGVNVSDQLQTLVAMDSKPAGNRAFAVEKFGPDSAQAKVDFENGDTNQALIRTKMGRLIEVRYDTASPRPSGMGQYSLQGTKASYESALGERKIFIEGKSPAHQWEPLEKYQDQYQHPYWKEHGADASKAGHGGGDFFVIGDFLRAVQSGKSAIDVIDAVTWTSVRPLSEQSIREGNKPMQIPDFRSATT